MKQQLDNRNILNISLTCSRQLIAATLIALPLSAAALDSFQQKALFSPYKSLLLAEFISTVTIIFPCFDTAEYLGRKRFINFPVVDILNG